MLRIQWHICKDRYSGIYLGQSVHISLCTLCLVLNTIENSAQCVQVVWTRYLRLDSYGWIQSLSFPCPVRLDNIIGDVLVILGVPSVFSVLK